MIRAVLFDMDGVLVDSEPHWKQYWQEEVFPRALDGEPTMDDVTGRNFRESTEYLDEEYGLHSGADRVEAEIEAFADEMYREKATVTEGMPELVEQLRARDLEIAIVSSSPRKWITQMVDRSELPDPDLIVSAEDIDDPGKPDPAVYEHAITQLEADAGTSVVVEDSKNGVRAASGAGTTVIRYQCDHEATSIPAADFVAMDITELRSRLLDLLEEV